MKAKNHLKDCKLSAEQSRAVVELRKALKKVHDLNVILINKYDNGYVRAFNGEITDNSDFGVGFYTGIKREK